MAEKRRKAEREHQYTSPTYRRLLERVARNVGRLRSERAWSQEEAAHRCMMSTRLYQQIEAQASNLTFTTLARLLDGFEVDVQALFEAPPRSRSRST